MEKSDSTQIILWTVGHSNRSKENFLELLKEHKIQVIADIRRFPTFFQHQKLNISKKKSWKSGFQKTV